MQTSTTPQRSFSREHLQVQVFGTEAEMGAAAADLVERTLDDAIREKGSANLILATGLSQVSFLSAIQERAVDWGRVTVFHLDEYRDLPEDHPASFRRYLREKILDAVQPGQVHLIDGSAADIDAEIDRYSSLLRENPVDIACIGIGENGHIAFNDPPVANFADPVLVKEVELDDRCRQQQVNEGWFPSIPETPSRALTLTIPAIMNSRVISCVVPGERKAEAVQNTLEWEPGPACPATVLRRHPDTTLFLDAASAARV